MTDLTPSTTIHRATTADTPQLVAVLTQAFDREPFIDWLIKRGRGRPQRIHQLFSTYLRLAFTHGEVYTTSDVSGAALWIKPGHWRRGLLTQIRLLSTMINAVGPLRIGSHLLSARDTQAYHPPVPHYYLLALGTEPDRQQQGIGTALMQPILARCDAEGIPAYLETPTPEHVLFYRGRGFKVLDTLQLTHDGPRVWFMWRQPKDNSSALPVS